MALSVSRIVQRQVPLDDIVRALSAAGAENVSVDRRTGDPYEAVDRYFYVEFDDPCGVQVRRVAYGFHASMHSEHQDGWTRFQLGTDEGGRGHFFVAAVAEAVGGRLHDQRTLETLDYAAEFEPEPTAPAFA